MTIQTVGVLGVGRMGESIVGALLRAGYASRSISLYRRDNLALQRLCNEYETFPAQSPVELMQRSEVIFLCTPADAAATAAEKLSESMDSSSVPTRIFVSLAAGVSSKAFSQTRFADRLVRIMPTTSIERRELILPSWCAKTDANLFPLANEFLASFSDPMWMEDENRVDGSALFYGSAVGYLSRFCELIAENGEFAHFDRGDSEKLLRAAIIALASSLEEGTKSFGDIYCNVATPGGVTERAGSVLCSDDGVKIVEEMLSQMYSQLGINLG